MPSKSSTVVTRFSLNVGSAETLTCHVPSSLHACMRDTQSINQFAFAVFGAHEGSQQTIIWETKLQ